MDKIFKEMIPEAFFKDTDGKIKLRVQADLEATDIQIGAVELKDAETGLRATIKEADQTLIDDPALTVSDKNVQINQLSGLQKTKIVNSDGDVVSSFGSPSTIAEFKSPSDFTATYTSNVTITLSALPFTITDSSQLVYIKVIPTTGDSQVLVNGSGGVTMTVSSNVVTVNGAGTPFASGDVYEVGINAQDKAFDPSTNSQIVSSLNNVWNQYTDAEVLVTAQDLTDAYADFGSEIDMRGYTKLGVWIITDVNDSENVNIKALVKHTSGGTDEYEILDGSGVVALWTTGASDSKVYVEFEVGASPFVQLQAIAGTVGATAGDLTISITKIY